MRKLEKQKANKNIIYLGFIFSVVIVYIFSKNIMNSYSIGIINDEFGYWGIAASWANKDWSGLLASTPYYSYGYSMIITGLYYIFNDPQIIYRIALCLNVTMILLSFLLAYQCGRKVFPDISKVLMLIISFAITVYSNNIVQAKIAWTETILYLLYWLLFFVVLKILEKPRMSYIAIYALLNVYTYCVHQRALGVLLSSVLLIIILVICKKLSVKHLVIFAGILAVVFYLGTIMKSNIVAELFTSKELVAMNDYSGQVSKIGEALTSLSGLRYLAESILGKLFYLGAATFLIGFLGLGMLIKQSLIGLVQMVKERFRQIDDSTAIVVYLLMSFGATFMISAISMYLPQGRLDLLIYGRYMEFAVGPLLMYGFGMLLSGKIQRRQIYGSLSVLVILSVLVGAVYSSLGIDSFNALCITGLSYFFNNINQVKAVPFFIVCIVGIVSVLFMFYIEKTTKRETNIYKKMAVIGIGIVWIFLSGFVGIEGVQKGIDENVVAVTEKLERLEVDYHICVLQNDDNADLYAKYLQYNLPDKCIIEIQEKDLAVEKEKNVIYLAYNDQTTAFRVPDGFVVLTKNKKLVTFTKKENVDMIQEWRLLEN